MSRAAALRAAMQDFDGVRRLGSRRACASSTFFHRRVHLNDDDGAMLSHEEAHLSCNGIFYPRAEEAAPPAASHMMH
eukprot:4127721-Pyramimonas_sp.AAC.1